MRVSRAQPDLRPAPGEIGFLGAQDGTNGVANLDEAPDDARMPRRYAVRALAVADRNGDGHAVDNLGEPVLDDEVAALLDRRAFGRGADADGLVDERLALEPRRGWGRIDVGGKRVERGEQVLKQGVRFGADRQTGVGRAIGARGPRVRSEDHVRMLDEVAIDRDRFLPVLRGMTSARSIQLAGFAGSSGPRFWKNRMSTTTSVPAAARMAPSGRRTAPTRSAMEARNMRAVGSALSMVQRLVTKAARPPGRSRSIDRAMK